jgi:hypothetical protein
MPGKPRLTREVVILSAVSAVAVGIGVVAAEFLTQDVPPQDRRESSESSQSAETEPIITNAAPAGGGTSAEGEEAGAEPGASADPPSP